MDAILLLVTRLRRVPRFALLVLFIALLPLAACGGKTNNEPPPTPTLDPVAAVGKAIFTTDCGPCHSAANGTVIVGPSLAGIADVAGTRVDGLDARTYLYTSILRPGDYIVEGFDKVMPENFGKKLTGEQIDGLVAYLLTLHQPATSAQP